MTTVGFIGWSGALAPGDHAAPDTKVSDLVHPVPLAHLRRMNSSQRNPRTPPGVVARCHHDLAPCGIRGVVSFSDPLPRHRRDGTTVMPGHVGTVYQALNFVYTGRTRPHSITMLTDGSVMHGRALAKIRAQHTGHRYAERLLEDLGASPIAEADGPVLWLRQALASIGAVNVRHPGNHRYCLILGGRRNAWHLSLAPHQNRPTRTVYQPELAALDLGGRR
jgi:hypothetical protein